MKRGTIIRSGSRSNRCEAHLFPLLTFRGIELDRQLSSPVTGEEAIWIKKCLISSAKLSKIKR